MTKFKLKARVSRADAGTIRQALDQLAATGNIACAGTPWGVGVQQGKRSLLYDDSQHCATFALSGSTDVARVGRIAGNGSG